MKQFRLPVICAMLGLLGLFAFASMSLAPSLQAETPKAFEKQQLIAWCIVPFDKKQRGPEARVQMLKEIGLKRVAYDWRQKHIPEFEQEFSLYKQNGIELFAYWVPTRTHADKQLEESFAIFEKTGHKPQIWRTIAQPKAATQEEKLKEAVNWVLPYVKMTEKHGLKFAVYNHGGWGGHPDNLIEICKRLQALGHKNVGIVYNWHHAHDIIEDWPALLKKMRPYLHCLNLNGMNATPNPKILGLGEGTHDKQMIKAVLDSGYKGPIGILGHVKEKDVKQVLIDNLAGLEKLLK